MESELIDEATFHRIKTNQSAILKQLELSDQSLEAFIQLSNRHYSEADGAFKQATSTIQRIRSNFDAIYKNIKLLKTKRKELEEKKELLRKANQVQIQFEMPPSPKLKNEEGVTAEQESKTDSTDNNEEHERPTQQQQRLESSEAITQPLQRADESPLVGPHPPQQQ